jgi:manganese transport protein
MALYRKILVALENSRADNCLVPHIAELAHQMGASLLLLHVADGWVARNYERLHLAESEEVEQDRQYLNEVAERLKAEGLQITTHLAMGDPPDEILKIAEAENCDLIAMTTHGHRLIGDLLYGSTITKVRHRTRIPVLLVHAQSGKQA